MNPLMFHCPSTGRAIEAGIDINYASLRKVQPVTLRLLCPFCDRPHEWKLLDGWIGEPTDRNRPNASPQSIVAVV
jgi:hypothetical protein